LADRVPWSIKHERRRYQHSSRDGAGSASYSWLGARERLNPTDLKWPNFLVAAADGRIVGAIQMRKHADGSRELGSLVVSKESRGQGVATRLIDALLATESGPVWMITANAFAGAYSRWGFRQIEPRTAPVKVRRNHRMGSLASIVSFFKRRPIRRLVILERLPSMRREALQPAFVVGSAALRHRAGG
jgi:amino-acid N-acetyltransferase